MGVWSSCRIVPLVIHICWLGVRDEVALNVWRGPPPFACETLAWSYVDVGTRSPARAFWFWVKFVFIPMLPLLSFLLARLLLA